MVEMSAIELVDLLDAGFEPIEIDYLCFLRWAVRHGEISEGSADFEQLDGELSSGTREQGEIWEQARTWVGGLGG